MGLGVSLEAGPLPSPTTKPMSVTCYPGCLLPWGGGIRFVALKQNAAADPAQPALGSAEPLKTSGSLLTVNGRMQRGITQSVQAKLRCSHQVRLLPQSTQEAQCQPLAKHLIKCQH